jgi:hypothetical protein
MYGPLRTGHSLGMSDQGTGLSIQARVHDLAEMDRAALEAAGSARRARDDVLLSPSAEHAYETLRARPNARDRAIAGPGAAGTKTPPGQEAKKNSPPEGPSTEKLLDRARQAEAAGKRHLALAFLHAARDQGSAPAQHEIDRLNRKAR